MAIDRTTKLHFEKHGILISPRFKRRNLIRGIFKRNPINKFLSLAMYSGNKVEGYQTNGCQQVY